MSDQLITGALLGRAFDVGGDARVRLRLARSSDARAVGELLSRQRSSLEDVDVSELLQYDPRQRYVICATALIDGRVTLVGLGAIDLVADEGPEPDLLIVAPELDGTLGELMWRVLVRAAQVTSGAEAA